MFTIPFFEELESSKNILLSGCGGGFDVYSTIPFYLALKEKKKVVHLSSFNFGNLEYQGIKISHLCPHCAIVTHETRSEPYFHFPESLLSKWFQMRHQIDVPIHTIYDVGTKQIKIIYEKLVDALDLDTIILVDGGTDSLMRGDEEDLGSPTEDIISLIGANFAPVEKSYLVSIGFGIDAFHGVPHFDVLNAMSDLIKANAFKGCFSLMKEMPEVEEYIDAVNLANLGFPYKKSIVQNSIVSALEGEFGDFHRTNQRTDSTLFINPLMSQAWCFDLKAVYERNLYVSQILDLERKMEVHAAIRRFHKNIKKRKRNPIPL